MNDIAVRAEKLSKLYHIGKRQEKYKTLRDSFSNALLSPFRRAGKLLRGQATAASELDETIWALKDISFEIKRSEVVGIIGRNGAGKSTLLKILSRITEPTEGFAEINGRVGSLLEVGTGFHSELTGRENIYLNGAIIGMKRAEINHRFDEIVAFAEVEKFIDTPVKHYSSGMYLRLAFAVAAHLEPEILLIDEVLAVGDAAFQKKCLGKMGDVAKQGRTVLFVSHNMAAVSALCPKSIILQNGTVDYVGQTEKATQLYLSRMQDLSDQPLEERPDRKGDRPVKALDLWLENSKRERSVSIACGDKVSIGLSYKADKVYRRPRFIVGIYNAHEVNVLTFDTDVNPIALDSWPTYGVLRCDLSIPFPLSPGLYSVRVAIFAVDTLVDYVANALRFDVVACDFFGTGKSFSHWPSFLIANKWSIE